MALEVHGPSNTPGPEASPADCVAETERRAPRGHGGGLGSAALPRGPVRPRPRPPTPAGPGERCRGAAAWCASAPPKPHFPPPHRPLYRPVHVRPPVCPLTQTRDRARAGWSSPCSGLHRPVSRPPRHPLLGRCDAGLRALRAACEPGTSDITAASADPEARAPRAPPRSDSLLASREGPVLHAFGETRLSPRPCARGARTSAPCPGWGRPCCPSGAAEPPHEAGPDTRRLLGPRADPGAPAPPTLKPLLWPQKQRSNSQARSAKTEENAPTFPGKH